jgi:hypothetical protein
MAGLTAVCVEPPVKPIPNASRRTITSISDDVSGLKDSDASKRGARASAAPTGTWARCGERQHFVQMGADNAATVRTQIDTAAAVLAEAIPYDLYVNQQPRGLKIKGVCIDFSDLPSAIGRQPGRARS